MAVSGEPCSHLDLLCLRLGAILGAHAAVGYRREVGVAMTSLGADAGDLDEDAGIAEVRRLSRFRAADIVRSASERVVSDLGDLDELTPRGASEAIEATTERLMASRVGRNGRSITSAAANGATVAGARQSGVTAQKVWITGQNARPTHAAMNGQRADIDRRFSNGARWPGNPSLPPHESCGCNCHVEDREAKGEVNVRQGGGGAQEAPRHARRVRPWALHRRVGGPQKLRRSKVEDIPIRPH